MHVTASAEGPPSLSSCREHKGPLGEDRRHPCSPQHSPGPRVVQTGGTSTGHSSGTDGTWCKTSPGRSHVFHAAGPTYPTHPRTEGFTHPLFSTVHDQNFHTSHRGRLEWRPSPPLSPSGRLYP